MAQRKLDALLVSYPANRRYLSGFTGSAGFLLITRDSTVLATDFRYTEQARVQAPAFDNIEISGGFDRWLPELISRFGIRRLGFEADDLVVSAYRQLVKAVKAVSAGRRPSLISTTGVVAALRSVKDVEEIRKIARAAELADQAAAHAAAIMKPGLTEKHIAWELEKFFKENGSEPLPFDIIVASGPNAALPHAQPGERVIGEGEPVIVDLGARLEGYTSDMTRTFYLGQPDDTFGRVYQTVYRAQTAAIDKLEGKMRGHEADRLARTVIESAGYGAAFGHGLGHGVGLETHESPRLGPGSDDILREGMVFTIEPGIYLPGWGGVRIEDMVSLDKGRPKLLTTAPK